MSEIVLDACVVPLAQELKGDQDMFYEFGWFFGCRCFIIAFHELDFLLEKLVDFSEEFFTFGVVFEVRVDGFLNFLVTEDVCVFDLVGFKENVEEAKYDV